MPNNPNAEDNLIKYKKGQSGNPKGRPKKWVSNLKGVGYTKSEINDCLMNMMSMSIEEINEVVSNENATMLELTVAKAMQTSIKKGSLYSMDTLWNRVLGHPKQEVEQTIIEKPIFNGIDLNMDEEY